MQERTIKIIIGILIVIMILISILGIILYFATDLLKPKNDLFEKYFLQNIAEIASVIDVSEDSDLIKTLQNENYVQTTSGTIKYLEKKNYYYFLAYK